MMEWEEKKKERYRHIDKSLKRKRERKRARRNKENDRRESKREDLKIYSIPGIIFILIYQMIHNEYN